MIMEDIPTEEASVNGVGDGEAGVVESRAIGDGRGEYPSIDTSLKIPGDGESARRAWRNVDIPARYPDDRTGEATVARWADSGVGLRVIGTAMTGVVHSQGSDMLRESMGGMR